MVARPTVQPWSSSSVRRITPLAPVAVGEALGFSWFLKCSTAATDPKVQVSVLWYDADDSDTLAGDDSLGSISDEDDGEASELGLKKDEVAKIREIHQLRPLVTSQPWGVFFISLEDKALPVTVLRRILKALILNRRGQAKTADRQAWHLNDLIFAASFGQSLPYTPSNTIR